MTPDEIREHITVILNQEIVISLATTGSDGLPWASMVHYAIDDTFTIYWLSSENTRHSQNIAHNHYAAGTITAPLDEKDEAIGLQLEGWAGLATDLGTAKQILERKRKKEYRADLLDTHKFYMIKPRRIYLIHEPLLGFKRMEYLVG